MNEFLLSRSNLGATQTGEPVWEVAYFYPVQGQWSENEYLSLESRQFLIEFDNGYLEFLPMPTRAHQRITLFLYRILWSFLESKGLGGEVLVAPVPVNLWGKKYREPDIVYLSAARAQQSDENYPEGADLVMEVVSGSVQDRYRDMVKKREEYAQAGIPEYWIVDPDQKLITVLHLVDDTYAVHGEFGEGEQAASVLLAGFAVAVTAVFAAAE